MEIKKLITEDDCLKAIPKIKQKIHLTFLDPPFNQNKEYRCYSDNISYEDYWGSMESVCKAIYDATDDGGAIYFMQREKNTEEVLRTLRKTDWNYQNLIIWRKKSSAVPCTKKFGLHYQVIAYAIKGDGPRVFNKLRIDPILLVTEKYKRPNGMFVTDVWDDIRELTSGYFAGDEPLRDEEGERLHKQQSPISLLIRIILSSTNPGDWVLDPFAGTGTTLCVSDQLDRNSVSIEIDPVNIKMMCERMNEIRDADNVEKYKKDYSCTKDLYKIWKLALS